MTKQTWTAERVLYLMCWVGADLLGGSEVLCWCVVNLLEIPGRGVALKEAGAGVQQAGRLGVSSPVCPRLELVS